MIVLHKKLSFTSDLFITSDYYVSVRAYEILTLHGWMVEVQSPSGMKTIAKNTFDALEQMRTEIRMARAKNSIDSQEKRA